jgi:hypothetical protein
MVTEIIDWFHATLTNWQTSKYPSTDSEKLALHVMHANDIVDINRKISWKFTCDECSAKVGVFPTGQHAIRHFGRPMIRIVCSRCNSFYFTEPVPDCVLELSRD